MRYSTGPKKRSRLQGHRKRRKKPEVVVPVDRLKLTWTGYKTIRQYQTMGDMLDECKAYGYKGALEEMVESYSEKGKDTARNGYVWLTKDP